MPANDNITYMPGNPEDYQPRACIPHNFDSNSIHNFLVNHQSPNALIYRLLRTEINFYNTASNKVAPAPKNDIHRPINLPEERFHKTTPEDVLKGVACNRADGCTDPLAVDVTDRKVNKLWSKSQKLECNVNSTKIDKKIKIYSHLLRHPQ